MDEMELQTLQHLPSDVRKLINAYVQPACGIDSSSSIYWERRHDATATEWNEAIERAPHLSVWYPNCPIVMLLHFGLPTHMDWALRHLRSKRPVNNDLQYILHYAAENGHVFILQELRLTWGLGKLDVQYMHNHVIRYAARYGHVHILRELRLNWGLEKTDALAVDNYALRYAAENGHVLVLEELRLNWGLTKKDAQAFENDALRSASACGHVSVIQELRLHWG